MKPEDQIKALAELDGWRSGYVVGKSNYPAFKASDGRLVAYVNLPRYLKSYDAIIPLIQKQDGETKNLVEDYIEECQTMKTSFWYDATPSQLCEALLRATGKGKD